MSNANVDLTISKGKVELLAACDNHTHSGCVLSEIRIRAFFHAIPSGVETIVEICTLRNAHFGCIISVVMQARDGLAVGWLNTHLCIVVSEVARRTAERTIVALAR